MLADPRLLKTQLIKVFNELQVSLESQRRILANRVEGRKKDSKVEMIACLDSRHVLAFLMSLS
jgi:hypothetical protein